MNDSMAPEEFTDLLTRSVRNIFDFTEGAVYGCMCLQEIDTLKQVFEREGGHVSDMIIWVKSNNFTIGRGDYQKQYEPILYGWREGQPHYFIDRRDLSNVWEDLKELKTSFKDGYTTISFQGFQVRIKGKVEEGQVIRKKQHVDIWRYDKPARSDLHPTMKPVALVCEAIRNSSLREQAVLDLFLGSGSTLMACELEARACYMMDLDPQYIQVTIDRWEEFSGKKAVLVEREGGIIGGIGEQQSVKKEEVNNGLQKEGQEAQQEVASGRA